ncbi:MAG: Rieske (2Fe-2S) protein [Acidobacteria bacterium]|nr:Rieske (2Fe-2S) protein [Acidobacteriota bacterium]
MPFVRVASISELKTGSVVEVHVDGTPYALCNVKGEILALGGVCPHRGGALGQGLIRADRVQCPWHAWEFDCRTGASDRDPSKSVPSVPVKLEGNDILIEVP